MTKLKKIIRRTVLIFLMVIPISAFAHFIFFPQQTCSILIDYSDFKKDGRLYFNSNTPQNKIDTVKSLIELASKRVAAFWGQNFKNTPQPHLSNQGLFTIFVAFRQEILQFVHNINLDKHSGLRGL